VSTGSHGLLVVRLRPYAALPKRSSDMQRLIGTSLPSPQCARIKLSRAGYSTYGRRSTKDYHAAALQARTTQLSGVALGGDGEAREPPERWSRRRAGGPWSRGGSRPRLRPIRGAHGGRSTRCRAACPV